MIEASLVLPLLILSVITCLLICMFFYESTAARCGMHLALRCEAGELTGRTVYPDGAAAEEPRVQIETRRGVTAAIVSGKEDVSMLHQGLIGGRISTEIESIWHASDGVSYVRHCVIARQMTETK